MAWHYVCLFGVLHPTREVFNLMETSQLPVEGCKFWLVLGTHGHWAWPLSSEGSLACHTFCDMEHPFKIVISEDPWHSHLLPTFSSGAVTTCFYDLGLSWLEFEQPTFRLQGKRSNPLRHRRGLEFCMYNILNRHGILWYGIACYDIA